MDLQWSGKEISDAQKGEIIGIVEKLTRKKFNYKDLKLRIHSYENTGFSKKYSVEAQAFTNAGTFMANAHSWVLRFAIKDIITKLQKQIHGHIRKRRGD